MTALNRALGAFYGLALGDALGMPTQSLDRETIKARFGQITDLQDAGPLQPIAANMPKGSITDDTEQAILVGELLVEGHGRIEPAVLAHQLDRMGSRDAGQRLAGLARPLDQARH